jgi:hypothetical protein
MAVDFFWIIVYRMPRQTKVTAVTIDDQSDLTFDKVDDRVFTRRVADQREPKTEAEQMTDIINEANVTETFLSNEYEAPVAQAVQTAPKAKIKRMSQKEAVFREPEVELTSSLDEVQAEVVSPKQEPVFTLSLPEGSQTKGQVLDQREEVEPKVACPDCGKHLSAKALKYTHGPNCVIR